MRGDQRNCMLCRSRGQRGSTSSWATPTSSRPWRTSTRPGGASPHLRFGLAFCRRAALPRTPLGQRRRADRVREADGRPSPLHLRGLRGGGATRSTSSTRSSSCPRSASIPTAATPISSTCSWPRPSWGAASGSSTVRACRGGVRDDVADRGGPALPRLQPRPIASSCWLASALVGSVMRGWIAPIPAATGQAELSAGVSHVDISMAQMTSSRRWRRISSAGARPRRSPAR